MKFPILSACLAVAAACAAELKDPAAVANDWKNNMDQALAPLLAKGPLGLTVAPPAAPATPPVITGGPAPRPRHSGDVMEVPPGWRLDPKFLREVPGETPPKGAKPWYYRGQKFWIIPIASAEAK